MHPLCRKQSKGRTATAVRASSVTQLWSTALWSTHRITAHSASSHSSPQGLGRASHSHPNRSFISNRSLPTLGHLFKPCAPSLLLPQPEHSSANTAPGANGGTQGTQCSQLRWHESCCASSPALQVRAEECCHLHCCMSFPTQAQTSSSPGHIPSHPSRKSTPELHGNKTQLFSNLSAAASPSKHSEHFPHQRQEADPAAFDVPRAFFF